MFESIHSFCQKRLIMQELGIVRKKKRDAPARPLVSRIYSSLRSLSQLGRERILMPDTTPIAAKVVRMEEPP